MKKRFLALILCLVMVLGLVPMALADGSSEPGQEETTAMTKYVIHYDANGGEMEDSSNANVATGEKIPYRTATKDGYTLEGWNWGTTAGDISGGHWVFDTTMGTAYKHVYLTADWKPITYTVKYMPGAEGATGTMTDETWTYGQPHTVAECGYTREGYDFASWLIVSTLTENIVRPGTINYDLTSVAGGTVTLKAQWVEHKTEAELSYMLEGGTIASDATYTEAGKVSVGAEITAPAADKVTKDGYTFAGWYTDFNLMQPFTSGTKMTSDGLTLFAKWERAADTYFVTFIGNGETSGTMSAQKFTKDTAQRLTKNTFKRTGYTFLGWATTDSATTAKYMDRQSIKLTADLTLYAVWEQTSATVKVTFDCYYHGDETLTDIPVGTRLYIDPNGGKYDSSTKTQTVTLTRDYTVKKAVRTGYQFYGWYVTQDSKGDYTFEAVWNNRYYGTYDIDYFDYDAGKNTDATFAAGTSIVIDPNGGTAKLNGTSFSKEKKISIYDDYVLSDAVRTGYVFYGWDLTKSGSTYTFTAMWANRTDTVPYMLNGSDHYAYIKGYPGGSFKPNATITRAEASAIFYRLLTDSTRKSYTTSYNTFKDVPATAWYNTAVSTMAKLGIVTGGSDGYFRPDDPITRAEIAAMIARCDGSYAGSTYTSFSDVKGHWAASYIARAYELGWINGYGTTYAPDRYITRAETVAIINRVLNRAPEYTSDLTKNLTTFTDVSTYDWFYLDVEEAANSHTYTRKTNDCEYWNKLISDPSWL